jgi:hypothetical protein
MFDEQRDYGDEQPDQDAPRAIDSHANAFTAWTVGKRVTEVVETDTAVMEWHPNEEGHSLSVPDEG